MDRDVKKKGSRRGSRRKEIERKPEKARRERIRLEKAASSICTALGVPKVL